MNHRTHPRPKLRATEERPVHPYVKRARVRLLPVKIKPRFPPKPREKERTREREWGWERVRVCVCEREICISNSAQYLDNLSFIFPVIWRGAQLIKEINMREEKHYLYHLISFHGLTFTTNTSPPLYGLAVTLLPALNATCRAVFTGSHMEVVMSAQRWTCWNRVRG